MVKNSKKVKAANVIQRDPPTSIKSLFGDLMSKAEYGKIDPHACIPFSKYRTNSKSGVARLMHLFDCNLQRGVAASDGNKEPISGIMLGTDCPMVVELSGSLKRYVYEYFITQNMSKVESLQKVASREVWYGIIDGEHRHEAILKLISMFDRWKGYQWFVSILPGGHEFEEYKQLAIMQNARHDSAYFVEVTFFDQLNNMRIEYDRLKSLSLPSSGSEVAKSYSGLPGKNVRTLAQLANTAIRLPIEVIRTVGEIVNKEHPDVCLLNKKLNCRGARTVDDVMSQVDCRIFRKFVNLTSIKSSTSFMNATGNHGINAQICTLHRARFLCQKNGLKPVQHDTISKQFDLSKEALEEDRKFRSFLSPDDLPQEMVSVQSNLLHTTILDGQIEKNKGSSNLLPALLESYHRHYPVVSAQKLAKMRASLRKSDTTESCDADSHKSGSSDHGSDTNSDSEIDDDDRDDTSTETDSDSPSDGNRDGKLKGGDKKNEDESGKEKEQEPVLVDKLEAENNNSQVLDDFGIKALNLKWQTYSDQELSKESDTFDLIITDPPSAPSRSFIKQDRFGVKSSSEEISQEELKSFPDFCSRALKTGGYVFMFIPLYMFQEWYQAFLKSGFSVMSTLYTVLYDENTFPRRNVNDFPQTMSEFALIARSPGDHPRGFCPDFNSSFGMVKSRSSRRRTAMDNIPFAKYKLRKQNSRAPYRTSEKPIALVSELIDMFTPYNGSVLDTFSGTMTTAIAALKTSRVCTVIESDTECYNAALERLKRVADVVHSQRGGPNGQHVKSSDVDMVYLETSSPEELVVNSQDVDTEEIKRNQDDNEEKDGANLVNTNDEDENRRSNDITITYEKGKKGDSEETEVDSCGELGVRSQIFKKNQSPETPCDMQIVEKLCYVDNQFGSNSPNLPLSPTTTQNLCNKASTKFNANVVKNNVTRKRTKANHDVQDKNVKRLRLSPPASMLRKLAASRRTERRQLRNTLKG